jgi:hypothetical protein
MRDPILTFPFFKKKIMIIIFSDIKPIQPIHSSITKQAVFDGGQIGKTLKPLNIH